MIQLTEPLTFITGNKNKLLWTQKYTPIPLIHEKIDLTEIQDLDVMKVSEHKVKEAYSILKKPVLVEDTSLIFDELGNLPGTFIKWFLDELGDSHLCKLITTNRKALSHVVFAFYNGNDLYFFDAILYGSIAEYPRGSKGFGWDTIFIPQGFTKTHAEMTDEERTKISNRRIAIEKITKVVHYAK